MAAKKPNNKTKVKKTATRTTPTKPTAKTAPARNAAATPAKQGTAKAAPTAKTTAAPTPRAKQAKEVVTTIVAYVDAGFGNELFIRGTGGDLSWETGVKMECVGATEWRFTTTNAQDLLEVKFLLNDDAWSQGENVVVPPGAELVVEPSF